MTGRPSPPPSLPTVLITTIRNRCASSLPLLLQGSTAKAAEVAEVVEEEEGTLHQLTILRKPERATSVANQGTCVQTVPTFPGIRRGTPIPKGRLTTQDQPLLLWPPCPCYPMPPLLHQRQHLLRSLELSAMEQADTAPPSSLTSLTSKHF